MQSVSIPLRRDLKNVTWHSIIVIDDVSIEAAILIFLAGSEAEISAPSGRPRDSCSMSMCLLQESVWSRLNGVDDNHRDRCSDIAFFFIGVPIGVGVET